MRDLNPVRGAYARSLWRLPLTGRIGWLLYALSMLTPASAHSNFIGAFMLIFAPLWGFTLLGNGTARGAMIGMCLLAGFAANASVFVRLPRWARIAAIVAPWLCYAASLFALGGAGGRRLMVNAFFFPWAVGIALINLVHLEPGRARTDGES